MRFQHRVLVVALCCAALAWIAGPAGRLLVAMPLLLFGPGYLFERAWPALRRVFGEIRPAATMISAGLADPRMRIEIEVTARRDAER